MAKISKKLLIINQNAGYLTIDVANAMMQKYDEVVLMAGRVIVTDRNLHPNIKIQKTIAYDRTSTTKRLWTWTLCTLHLFILLLCRYRTHHILYYTNPSISYFNSIIFSNPFSIVIFDTYPDALRLTGIQDNHLIFKMWVWMNKKIFPKAQQIITLSEGMKSQLLKYVREDKIKVVPIWPATEKFKPIPKSENDFLIKNNWQNKFIILYSGNMGIGHNLELLVDTANEFISEKDVLFLFIGEGAKKQKLQNLTLSKNLTNIAFLTWQNADILPYSLASADIAVVALEPEVTHSSVPSKTFNYMAVGAPLLCLGQIGSELENLISKHNNGLFLYDDDLIKVKNFIYKLKDDNNLFKKYQDNSLLAVKNYTFNLSEQYIF